MSGYLTIQEITAICLICICKNANTKKKSKNPKGYQWKSQSRYHPYGAYAFFHFIYICKETKLVHEDVFTKTSIF